MPPIPSNGVRPYGLKALAEEKGVILWTFRYASWDRKHVVVRPWSGRSINEVVKEARAFNTLRAVFAYLETL